MANEKIINLMRRHAVLIVCVFCAVLVVLCCGKTLRHNRNGAGHVGSALNAARQEQQGITTGLEGAARQAEQLDRDLQGAGEALARIDSTIADTGDSIRDCQQVITGVRKRGPLKTASY